MSVKTSIKECGKFTPQCEPIPAIAKETARRRTTAIILIIISKGAVAPRHFLHIIQLLIKKWTMLNNTLVENIELVNREQNAFQYLERKRIVKFLESSTMIIPAK